MFLKISIYLHRKLGTTSIHVNIETLITIWHQHHSEMKIKTNIAFEGTCNGDVLGGLLLLTGENLQALLFGKDNLSGLSWEDIKQSPWSSI
jgi:hypothetical protein